MRVRGRIACGSLTHRMRWYAASRARLQTRDVLHMKSSNLKLCTYPRDVVWVWRLVAAVVVFASVRLDPYTCALNDSCGV